MEDKPDLQSLISSLPEGLLESILRKETINEDLIKSAYKNGEPYLLKQISSQLDTIIEKLARIEQVVTTPPEPKVETRTKRQPRA